MNSKLIIQICKQTAEILADMDGETSKAPKNGIYPLIFPEKVQKKGSKFINRISEQELRILFIQELEIIDRSISYSIETPTKMKYKLGKHVTNFKAHNIYGQSALIDLTLFEFANKIYNRILNIEFKHSVKKVPIAKDLFKLVNEPEDGVIILLLDNSNRGTFCNNNQNRYGLFNKLFDQLSTNKMHWSDINKRLLIIIISLGDKLIISKEITQTDLAKNLPQIFQINQNKISMNQIQGWHTQKI